MNEPPSSVASTQSPQGNLLQLVLATGGYAICFAVFGTVAAMMPTIRETLELTPLQAGIAMAMPVLLGSLGRIPLGMLADRFGARVVFAAVMFCSMIPVVMLGWVESFEWLLVCGFFIGLGLASFVVGVNMVSRWYPPHRQGMALGIYGAGHMGQSLATLGSPLLAAWLGYAWGFWGVAILTAIWLGVFLIGARNAPQLRPPAKLSQMLESMKHPSTWALSFYYFLTFGSCVAMGLCMPLLMTEMFGLSKTDAGLRTTVFIILATLMRPVGGAWADRIGGARILAGVFPAAAVLALVLMIPNATIFLITSLLLAMVMGMGSGAIFKLLPEYFPDRVGSVTGLVGASGGLGGFFPPLVVAGMYHLTGHYAWGFIPLSLTALACLLLLWYRLRRISSLVATAAMS